MLQCYSIFILLLRPAMQTSQLFMKRCIDLARLGSGMVAPNPMVGAVLVYNAIILGEGYHQQYGQAHAEVNCLNSIPPHQRHLIKLSTLYVSLEPCAHFGKTPPCANLIVSESIPNVIIGCSDPFEKVNGRGIDILKQAGVNVVEGMLDKECRDLNKRFFTYHLQKRPYITLKWAQSQNRMMGKPDVQRLKISNGVTDRMVHKMRHDEAAILVGTQTALLDDPQLNNRWWAGKSPTRLVLDLNGRLPLHLKVYDETQPTVVFVYEPRQNATNIQYVTIQRHQPVVQQVLAHCYQLQIQSILVEGGGRLLQSFIDSGCWDEAVVIENEALHIANGVAAPVLPLAKKIAVQQYGTDRIATYLSLHQSFTQYTAVK